ncbi:hypothetical protein L596_010379 [Steinernema carpocapsae]|uniref:Uncharacterized protein n=1 Tax=Steinernema carpocapsae TaxID=34508 RepID=A0A4V6A6W4_STECR|nr:hypothetical protein L596_010379 [Steinernema carpocapsae]
MDTIVYSFAYSVAHLLSKASVILFASFDSPFWSSVGETHCEMRVDHQLFISGFNNETKSYVGQSYNISNQLALMISSIRISLTEPSEEWKNDLLISKKLLNDGHFCNVVEIHVSMIYSDSYPFFLNELLLIPVRKIMFMTRIESLEKYLHWHIEINCTLKFVVVLKSDIVLALAGLWKTCPIAQYLNVQIMIVTGPNVYIDETLVSQYENVSFHVCQDKRPQAISKHPLNEGNVLTLDRLHVLSS